MNETPERICEALGWLCGGEWADNGLERGKPSFATIDGDQYFEWDPEDGYCLHRGWFKRNIEEELAHALEVTALWEWAGDVAQLPLFCGGAALRKCSMVVHWNIMMDCGPDMEDFEASEDLAKTAARAAYLCWMRGQFAMKGGLV